MTESLTITDRLPPMSPTVVRVVDYRRETHDAFTLTLEAPTANWSFLPGQFHMLYVFGVGEAAISLSGDPGNGRQAVHTIRTVGSVTKALERLQPGQQVGIRGPFGNAWPMDEAKGHDVMITAGGIGLAPLRPVLYELSRRRANFGRITLLYGARTPGDLLYMTELAEWQKRGDFEILTIVDRGDPSIGGRVGLVTALFAQAEFAAGKTIGMMCGPEVMMRFAQREFAKRGVDDQHVYLSLERNMQCAIGFCGHCQFGPEFICMDGPVFRFDRIKSFFNLREA